MGSFIVPTYLDIQESTNSRQKNVICTRKWICKRLICRRCYLKRRAYFIKTGSNHIQENGLDTFLTLSWINHEVDDPWSVLTGNSRWLFKKLSGRLRYHYIRVLSLGMEENTPHVHIVLSNNVASIISAYSKEHWGNDARLNLKPITGPHGLLGYLFDQNYKLSFLDESRPKGIRLLTASRPLKTGFPTGLELKALWERSYE